MDPSDFYLASAAVIPIIALAQAVQRSITLSPRSEETEAVLRRVVRRARIGNVAWTAAESVLFVWAEFICLRRLETGSAPFGGSSVVWIALAYGAAYVTLLRLGGLVEADDVHALVAWSERRLVRPRTSQRRSPGSPIDL